MIDLHAIDLLPAIDLRRGQVVRLTQGDDDRATVYGDDPAAVLRSFAAAGVSRAHLVDLDAALGDPPQSGLLAALAEIPEGERPAIQVGGGLRDEASIAAVLAAGAERAVVGSLVARQPDRFAELARRFAGRLVPALDVRHGEVATAGWTAGSGWEPEALAARLAGLPCPAVLVTDVERDGTMEGPNVELARRVGAACGLPALVSGGVSALADLEASAAVAEVGGVIVGRALYEGRFTLEEALAACRGEAR